MNNSEKLQRILDRLNDLLFKTWSAFLVAKNLDPIIGHKDFVLGRYFIISAYVSCVESTLLGFSKLTSNKKDEISIGYLLNSCKENYSAFTTVNRTEVQKKVETHQKKLSELEPLTQQVKSWRDKAIAHLDRKYANDSSLMTEMQPVDFEDLGRCFIFFQDIINVYREWLGMQHQLRLQDTEVEMLVEWKYLSDLIKQNTS